MDLTRTTALGVLAIIAGLAGAPVCADDKGKRREVPQTVEIDQDEALARLQKSESKPLSDIIAAGQKVIPGEVVRVRLKGVRGRLAYELKIITSQGHVREVYIDPLTLETLKVE